MTPLVTNDWSLTLRLLRLGRNGGVDLRLLLVLSLLLSQVGVGVVVAQARTILVTLPTDCQRNPPNTTRVKTKTYVNY